MNARKERRRYRRARLLNIVTGERNEIALTDFATDEEHNSSILAVDTNLELRADLDKAFLPFSPLQKRILLRVLLQGQSVDEAAKHSKRSRRWWANWIRNVAMPHLRTALADYVENGKLVLR